MRVYRNGSYLTEISDPYGLEGWARASGYDPSTLSLDLAELKAHKVAEIRERARAEAEAVLPAHEALYLARSRGCIVSRASRG